MTAETIKDPAYTMGWPLSASTLQGFADRLQAAHEAQHDEIVAAYDPETGFCLACHVIEGRPFFWECCGPLSQTQADAWAAGLSDTGHARVLM